MAIKRYFFWIEENQLELYNNGKLEKYNGEKFTDISLGVKKFFEIWKENSAYIDERDYVDFIFIGENKEKLEKFRSFAEVFEYKSEKKFDFKELKNIIQEKNLGKFCLNINDEKEYFLQKTEFKYNKILKSNDLKTIYVFGNNISTNFLSNGITDMNIEVKDSNKSKMAEFFNKELEGYKE